MNCLLSNSNDKKSVYDNLGVSTSFNFSKSLYVQLLGRKHNKPPQKSITPKTLCIKQEIKTYIGAPVMPITLIRAANTTAVVQDETTTYHTHS